MAWVTYVPPLLSTMDDLHPTLCPLSAHWHTTRHDAIPLANQRRRYYVKYAGLLRYGSIGSHELEDP